MSLNSRGPVPRGRRLCGPVVALSSLAVFVGGCAHETQAPYSQTSWYAGGPKAPPPAPVPVDMEDDGRPAQLPPRVAVARAPDDPSEPWSPNYGGPASRPQQSPVAARPMPQGHQRVAATGDD
jgi:hypothetical protein